VKQRIDAAQGIAHGGIREDADGAFHLALQACVAVRPGHESLAQLRDTLLEGLPVRCVAHTQRVLRQALAEHALAARRVDGGRV
jgi:hypothetical protein